MSKSIKELLTILRDSLIENKSYEDGYADGLCRHIFMLQAGLHLISVYERRNLTGYINKRRPSEVQYQEFYYRGRKSFLYWWPIMWEGEEHRTVRIKFVEKLISEL